MTYNAYAESDRAGLPVFLYTFLRGDRMWRYANVDTDQVIEGAVYAASSIQHGDIITGPELAKASVKVTVPKTHPIAEMYRVSPPREEVGIIVQSVEYFDGDQEIETHWTGRITAPNWRPGICELLVEPAERSMKRMGLRQVQQRLCPYVLYGPGCKVNREAFRVDVTLQGVSALVLSSPQFADRADGKWAGGFIEWNPEDGITDRRFIFDHVGAEVTIDAMALDLKPGSVVRAYPGCARTTEACLDFDNILNYGGMPAFGGTNPFNGTVLF